MTGNDLFREIGNIGEEYIEEAERYSKKAVSGIRGIWSTKTKSDAVVKAADGTTLNVAGSVILKVAKSAVFRKTLATAACLVVCLGLVVTVQKLGIREDLAQSTESAISPSEGRKLDTETFSEAAGMTASTKAESMIEEGAEAENYAMQEAPKSAQTEAAKESAEEDGGLENSVNSMYSDNFQELLKADNALVVVHGTVETGQALWEEFLASVNAGKAAQIDVIRFTIEGDAIVKTIYYDGSIFRLCVDRTRDAERGTGEAYYEASFAYMQRIENTQEGGGKTVEYVLTNREEDSADGLEIGKKEYSIFYVEE